jgi:hypothetical protein
MSRIGYYVGVDFGYSFERSTTIVFETKGGVIYIRESDVIETRGLTIPEKEAVLTKHVEKLRERYPGIIEI